MPRVKLKGFFILDFGLVPVSKPGKQPSVLAVRFNIFRVQLKGISEVHPCPMDDPVVCKQAGIEKMGLWTFRICFEGYYIMPFGLERFPFFFQKASITEIRFNVLRIKFKSLDEVVVCSGFLPIFGKQNSIPSVSIDIPRVKKQGFPVCFFGFVHSI